jgi:hypothetical protein
MLKKYNLETEEIQRILSLHESYKKTLMKEQAQATTKKSRAELEQFFSKAKALGCLKDQNLVFDSFFNIKGENRSYIKGPSKQDNTKVKRIYDDFTWSVVDPASGAIIRQGSWSCPQLQSKAPEEVNNKLNDSKKEGMKKAETTDLNDSQKDILAIIKPMGWFHEPKPSDVQIDQGFFEKLDLTNQFNQPKEGDEEFVDNSGLVNKWKKYFPITQFKEGFFVYKKAKPSLPTVTSQEGLKPTAESCKTAIETLWNDVQNPMSYSLTDQEKIDYKKMVEVCAQPENAGKFLLRFGLKDKLKDLVNSKYRINSRL